jgi:NitT/TauT family transport system permease protein
MAVVMSYWVAKALTLLRRGQWQSPVFNPGAGSKQVVDGPPARAMTGRKRPRVEILAAPALLGCLLLAWQGYVYVSGVSAFILPPPSAVLMALLRLLAAPAVWRHVGLTALETGVGFLAATLLAIGVGFAVGRLPWLERTLSPFIVASQLVPKVALIPLFVVWFGYGPEPKLLVVTVMAFFPVFTSTVLGLRSIEPGHGDVMTCLNASAWQRLVRLELPSAAPFILSGMEVGVVLAIIGCVVAQMLGGDAGLGYLLMAKMNAYETDGLFAVLVLLAGLGCGFHFGVRALRRVLVPWHGSGG